MKYPVSNRVIDRPPRLARLLADAPAPGFEHHWEGELAGSSGAAVGCNIKLKASMAFHGALVDGRGRFANVGAGVTDAQATLSISGTLEADVISLRLWSASAELGRVPFEAAGKLECGGREMGGAWSVTCFNPDTCGCTGGGGTFRLKRVD